MADTIETILYHQARCHSAESEGFVDLVSAERIIALHEKLRCAERLAEGVCKETGAKHSPAVQRLIKHYVEAKEATK